MTKKWRERYIEVRFKFITFDERCYLKKAKKEKLMELRTYTSKEIRQKKRKAREGISKEYGIVSISVSFWMC